MDRHCLHRVLASESGCSSSEVACQLSCCLKLRFSPGALRHTSITRLKLKGILAAADGCLSTEQLMAVDEARRIMVKSIWRDSASAQEWNRTNGALLAERAARLSLFEDYSVSLLCPAEFTPTAAPAPTIRESAAIAS